ncbi:uncharacterized protein LOC144705657 [Wolffia australiana]
MPVCLCGAQGDSSACFRPEWTSSSFFSEALDELLPSSEQTPAISLGHELEVYMSSPPLKGTEPLHWWKVTGEHSYPRLATIAKEFLSVCATNAPSERFFSTGRAVITYKRSRLTAESVELLMTLKCWWRAEEGEDTDVKQGDEDSDEDPTVT